MPLKLLMDEKGKEMWESQIYRETNRKFKTQVELVKNSQGKEQEMHLAELLKRIDEFLEIYNAGRYLLTEIPQFKSQFLPLLANLGNLKRLSTLDLARLLKEPDFKQSIAKFVEQPEKLFEVINKLTDLSNLLIAFPELEENVKNSTVIDRLIHSSYCLNNLLVKNPSLNDYLEKWMLQNLITLIHSYDEAILLTETFPAHDTYIREWVLDNLTLVINKKEDLDGFIGDKFFQKKTKDWLEDDANLFALISNLQQLEQLVLFRDLEKKIQDNLNLFYFFFYNPREFPTLSAEDLWVLGNCLEQSTNIHFWIKVLVRYTQLRSQFPTLHLTLTEQLSSPQNFKELINSIVYNKCREGISNIVLALNRLPQLKDKILDWLIDPLKFKQTIRKEEELKQVQNLFPEIKAFAFENLPKVQSFLEKKHRVKLAYAGNALFGIFKSAKDLNIPKPIEIPVEIASEIIAPMLDKESKKNLALVCKTSAALALEIKRKYEEMEIKTAAKALAI